ncbi:restriction endonuclease subunit S [Dysosmobacter segnis]|uniref:Restriction endonuclease subunit S n=1 Tax=Dysosmobacter segnis TaxID=2763042 RepID=A0A923S8L3_9FIRM|nr:restriction endonuclease subunit S [Dysosmobacter segnis]MBC5771383.1 restriction endonuclease subunit S [Dysosmobacter segnis]
MDTKALRQKILDLAIRGKLVPQDPNDEPASVLLGRIRQQKQQMVKEGKLKPKDIKNDSVIFVGEDNLHYEKFADGSVKCIEDEIPFELPDGWAWSRLGAVAEAIGDGDHQPPPQTSFGVPFLVISNVSGGRLSFENTRFVSKEYFSQLPETRKPRNGDLLFTVTGSYGIPVLIDSDDKFCFQRHIAIVRPCTISNRYLYVILGSSYVKSICDAKATGTAQKTVGLATLRELLIPVAPYKEQMQIYAQTQDALSIVDSVSSDKEDLLNIIESAKAKILDLAIRGQLVPQDPTDEPASVLLERIRAEKEELIKQGKIKRDKKESVIFRGEDNSYYLKTGELVESLEDWDFEELPGGWSVCCLGELCDYGNCTNIDTADIADSAWILDLEDIEKNSGIVLQKVRQGERNAGSTKHRFHKGQVLYSKLRPYLNKVVLADEDGYCTSEILPLEFEWNILPQYARYFLMSPTFLRYANKCSYGVKMPRLGTADGKKAIILVPPLEEQKRIVIAIEQTFSQLAFITENLS